MRRTKTTRIPFPLPVQQYARCIDATRRPADHIGDWPTQGQVYPIEYRCNARTGKLQVHVLGFHAERPYGAFDQRRFETVADVWLN
ncbi:hypothetical protein SAMN02745146_2029 [Hymenobacter daecheongensis DSM 21074]|uniref:Uncharacterized protein n=1 Tax=Hymenobacter daecheongensis DSM 21074 TaxID=1121955 RepID=A0A1M6FDE6_9BACT|nr:hypothetical protein [Hymenobacter daecheongensis]SHI95649.1 hypothetical protein SAMN02745146_2029 [Hymenobacter daecheongensis DSM 21074]